MNYCNLENLKDHILAKNPYLQRGYHQAWKDNVLHSIWANDAERLLNILPNDSLGNYFYLRCEHSIKHEAQPGERLSDSGTQRLSFLDNIIIHLVVVTAKADELQLIDNLRNTVMMYRQMNIIPVSSTWSREQVIIEELSGRPVDDILPVLQRLKNETIVKLTLSATNLYVPGNCIKNPCKT